jgi:small subunit ribosomal protein S4
MSKNFKKIKLVKAFGSLPYLTTKIPKQKSSQSPFGPSRQGQGKKSPYKIRLIEKQRLRFNYALKEKQLVTYVNKAKKSSLLTGQALLFLLENRLDCWVYKLGFAPTLKAARQLVTHKHILLNGKKVSCPAYQCFKLNDLKISNLPSLEITFNGETKTIQCQLDCIKNFPLKDLLVVEYYSN